MSMHGWKCRRVEKSSVGPCLKQKVVMIETPRLHVQQILPDAPRERQTVQEEWKCRSKAEKEDEVQGLDLCVYSSPRCGNILLSPCLQITVCWDGPDSPWWLWPVCVCISFALRSRGHLNSFAFAAGHLHHGPHPPDSQSSAHQEPQRPSPWPSPPTAFLFWTGWQADHHFLCPFECTVNWLDNIPFNQLHSL